MALSPGARLGSFEVIAPIGAGGMGEVYRATDTNLKRQVAIKVLPETLAADPERLARFQREAEVLAALNHPNIAHIHGLERSLGTTALVMELVEGQTLADRIADGPIPIDEALPIAKQIAEALEAAHEQGIIHRDLKPANIKVRDDGIVKVLDFGLAKAMEPPGASSSVSMSPTIATPAHLRQGYGGQAMTEAGMILGTAAYMSPEQAKGKAVDKRADIWAFGAVLYEMFTGARAFEGEDVAETLVAVLRTDVNWGRLPDDVPSHVVTVIRHCLQKDPQQRIHDAGDMRLALEGAFDTASAPRGTGAVRWGARWRYPASIAITGALCAFLGGMVLRSLSGTPRLLPTRLEITLPSTLRTGAYGLAISPDGRTVVFDADMADGTSQLYQRRMDRFEVEPIPGTENAEAPFFSTDGAWVGFFTGEELKKVWLDGRPPVTLAAPAGRRRGASSTSDDSVLFSYDGSDGLWRVLGGGGPAERSGEAEPGADLRWVDVLPDGRAALVTVWHGSLEDAEIAIEVLATGERSVLVAGTCPRYSPSGHIVYWRDNALWVVPFDAAERRITGPAQRVIEGVAANAGGLGLFAVSADGSLAYVSGTGLDHRTLVWVERDGREVSTGAPNAIYTEPRVSPDGTQLAVADRRDQFDIWTYQPDRRTRRRLTYGSLSELSPAWTRDGRRIAFLSTGAEGGPGIFWKTADGSGDAERLSTGFHVPSAVTPDGRRLLYTDISDAGGADLGWLALDGDPNPETLFGSPFRESQPVVSPDGHWMAYMADDSGTDEIYVRPFPNVTEGRWQVSSGGGREAVWGPDGKELFYRDNSSVLAIAVNSGLPSTWSAPVALFPAPYRRSTGTLDARDIDVAPEGRFLMIKTGQTDPDAPLPRIRVVTNWLEELKRMVPAK